MSILENIVNYKIKEVAFAQNETPIKALEESNFFDRSCNSYKDKLNHSSDSGVIAEFKRKSPSRQDINLTAHLAQVTNGYVKAGASAISILTDNHFFGGQNEFVFATRKELPLIPLLRKEFIIDEYQIIESKALGADIILLIAEILTISQVKNFAHLARSLGMEVLLEMHTADQIPKYTENISVVGVNNRDLKTFEVDYDRSKKLYDQLPVDVPKIAESGLSDTDTCVMLHEHGFRGFLIGEQFMKQDDPGKACQAFIDDYMIKRSAL